MEKKVLIVGAGIAGLSTASYLQRNGFKTEIFELHSQPGGLCTAWTRNGFTFDGCIHWVMGSGPSSRLHSIWQELGAGDLAYIEWDEHMRVRLSDGDSFALYTDPDRLEAEMLRLSPEDGKMARFFASNIRRVSRIDMPTSMEKLALKDLLSFAAGLPSWLFLLPWLKRPVSLLVGRMKGPKLKEAFRRLAGDTIDAFPVGGFFMMLGFMAKKSSGYPIGGSRAFSHAIAAKYLSLGGNIRYGTKVDEIIVEDGRAVGVRGAWGEERGDYVISAADGHDTVRRLLGGRYPHPDLDSSFDGKGELRRYPSLLYIGLGLGRDFKGVPSMQSFTLDEPVELEGGALKLKQLGLRIFNFDPTLAPAGKTSAVVMIETPNDAYWTALRDRDRKAYEAEKAETARKVVAALDPLVPGLMASVETVDVATPCSFIRYTNNWHGSYEGWLPTIESFGKKISRTLPGLGNFYMIGQWTNPGGGLPPCGIGGRDLARRLCAQEGRRFKAD